MKRKTKFMIWGGLFAFILLKIVVEGMFLQYKEGQRREAFEPMISDFIEGEYVPQKESSDLFGKKMVIVNVKERSIDGLNRYVDDSVLANSLDEMSILVLVEWDEIKVGHYVEQQTQRTTGDAFQAVGDVQLIDWDSRSLIEEKRFIGSDPSKTVTSDGSYSGGRPYFKIQKYLHSSVGFVPPPGTY